MSGHKRTSNAEYVTLIVVIYLIRVKKNRTVEASAHATISTMPEARERYREHIADRIRELRGEETQESLCQRARVARKVLSNIENAIGDFQISSLEKILHALGVDFRTLFRSAVPSEFKKTEDRRLHERLQSLLDAGGVWAVAASKTIDEFYEDLLRQHSGRR
jgi:transcriptional regulator with XRE-family HTH domain